jgi:hypothetical protein
MTPRSFSIPDRIGNQGDGQVAALRAGPTLTGWWSKGSAAQTGDKFG